MCLANGKAIGTSWYRVYDDWRKKLEIGFTWYAERVQRTARQIAAIFGVNWGARIDLIHETATDRLRFLECDVAPLIGALSAFAASFEAAGIKRDQQLRRLLTVNR